MRGTATGILVQGDCQFVSCVFCHAHVPSVGHVAQPHHQHAIRDRRGGKMVEPCDVVGRLIALEHGQDDLGATPPWQQRKQVAKDCFAHLPPSLEASGAEADLHTQSQVVWLLLARLNHTTHRRFCEASEVTWQVGRLAQALPCHFMPLRGVTPGAGAGWQLGCNRRSIRSSSLALVVRPPQSGSSSSAGSLALLLSGSTFGASGCAGGA